MLTGLTAGVLLAVIGLTGSAIVFYKAIDEWLYPEMFLCEGEGNRLGAGEAFAAARQNNPEKQLLGIIPPRHENACYLAYHVFEEDGERAYGMLTVDPFTGATRGEYVFGKTVMTFLYKLHYTLLAGEVGAVIVGSIGLLFLVMLLTGYCLWWPRNKREWSRVFFFKSGTRGYRIWREWHRVSGFYTAPVLAVIAISGVYMIFPQPFMQVVSLVFPVSESASAGLTSDTDKAEEGAQTISESQAVDIASSEFPEFSLSRFQVPTSPEGFYTVYYSDPTEPRNQGLGNAVFVDRYTGDVLGIKRYSESRSGDLIRAWMFPLHNGEAFGLTGRLIVFCSGFLPLGFLLTGFWMWRIRHKQRKRSICQRNQPVAQKT